MNTIKTLIVLSCIVSLFITPNIALAQSVDDLLNKGVKLLEKGKFKESITYFDKALKIDQKNIDALNGKGVALYLMGKHTESLKYFDKVLKINPKDVTALLLKGQYYADGGRYKDAITYYDKVLKIDPKNEMAYSEKQTALQYIKKQSQITPDPNVAELNKQIENLKKGLTPKSSSKTTDSIQYKLFFVNSVNEECNQRNYQAMNFYNDVTKSYFSVYGIKYTASSPQCITSNQLALIDSEISSYDLVIVVTDVLLSETHLVEDSHAWGYYAPIGNSHLIVSNSYSLSTKSGSSAWTLTHELSHFILKIQNQPESIWKYWVHNIQDQVTQCKSDTSWDSYYGSMTYCPKSLYKTIFVQGKNVDVLPPYNSKSSSGSSEYSYDTRTVLTLNGVPSQANAGQLVTFTGNLKNTEGLPVQGATIYIKDEDAGSGDEILTTATTDSNGMFSASWYAENTDFWDSTIEVYAVYEGSYEVQKSKTGIYNLTILE